MGEPLVKPMIVGDVAIRPNDSLHGPPLELGWQPGGAKVEKGRSAGRDQHRAVLGEQPLAGDVVGGDQRQVDHVAGFGAGVGSGLVDASKVSTPRSDSQARRP